ncbi:hypothetical protein P355_0039 [Burkholderia cenocepacia KC-01]|nr:hypothetical protein P355_0039 [Burkholderia cenocepacia KC-01]
MKSVCSGRRMDAALIGGPDVRTYRTEAGRATAYFDCPRRGSPSLFS